MRIPYHWNHYRYCDYHTNVDIAVGFVSVSPYNEVFIWDELNINPKFNTTLVLAEKIADVSGDYKFQLDVIDPLANIVQGNTTRTTIQDLNDYLNEFKRQGICEGGYFIPADTKSERGRQQIRLRLHNSSLVKKPFNNEVVKEGIKTYLPTIWVFANCKQVRLSLKHWRESKGKPEVNYSHHCTGIEFLLKNRNFRIPILRTEKPQERRKVLYFQGRR